MLCIYVTAKALPALFKPLYCACDWKPVIILLVIGLRGDVMMVLWCHHTHVIKGQVHLLKGLFWLVHWHISVITLSTIVVVVGTIKWPWWSSLFITETCPECVISTSYWAQPYESNTRAGHRNIAARNTGWCYRPRLLGGGNFGLRYTTRESFMTYV